MYYQLRPQQSVPGSLIIEIPSLLLLLTTSNATASLLFGVPMNFSKAVCYFDILVLK